MLCFESQASLEAFLGWRQAGSPRKCPIALHMRRFRALFKRILKGSKKREKELRAEALAKNYRNESIKYFWWEINSIRRSSEKLLHTVESTEGDIVKMWLNISLQN